MVSTRRTKPITSNSLAETPSHFFKVILPSTLEDKKLSIPEKFVKKFGSKLSTVATLRVPNGRVWSVGLTKKARMIWFQDGWYDFVKYHSITIGYFLVFKYVKHSTFNVLIFDMTACEIHYPHNGGEESYKMHNGLKRDLKCAASLEISMYKHGLEPQSKYCKMQELMDMNESNDGNQYELRTLLEQMGIYITEKCTQLSAEEMHRVINIARLFKPKDPSFMVVLRSSCRHKYRLYVPAKFAKKYLSRDAKFIKIQASKGRECVLHIAWRKAGGFNLTKGWSEFSKNKKMEVGDICVFELIRKKDFLLKVSVFHATIE